ncbi:excinuclease ABC subunit UvrC, partial [Streptococcus pyogenes]
TEIKRLLDRLFPFKKCTNPANKVCFYYHLGQCNAHTICQTDKAYWKGLTEDVKHFLNGKDDKIVNQLKDKMTKASEIMEFERA